MNLLKYILPAVAMVAVCTSCDDYLDVKPVGKLIPTEVTHFENLLNNTNCIDYFMIDNNRNCSYAFLGDNVMLSENHVRYQYEISHPNLDVLAAYIFYSPIMKPTSTPFCWSRGIYLAVGYFNNVIDGIAGLGANDDYARGVIAQARAGRAWVYMNAALVYGPMYNPDGANDTPCIPLRTSGDPTVSNGPLATTAEIFAQVKEDLDYACENCPDNVVNPCRATKAAAYALRAEYHMYTRNWEEMRKDADEAWRRAVATKGGADNLIYNLNDFYYEQVSEVAVDPGVDPRTAMVLRGPDNKFEVTENREFLLYRPAPYGESPSRFYPSDDWASIFDRTSDKRWDLFALMDNGFSKVVGDVKHDDGVHLACYRDEGTICTIGLTYPLLLIAKAEAEARSGKNADALSSLNLLRHYRYSGADTDVKNGASLSSDKLLEEILAERRREQHIVSFQRIIDLKRYCFDSGKAWSKPRIVHKVGDKEFSADVQSDKFQLNIDNAIIEFNPQWGLTPMSSDYNPCAQI